MIARRHLLAASVLTPLLPRAMAAVDTAPLSDAERAVHALNRLGFGPRPADAAAIAAQGPKVWLDQFLTQQLQPSTLAMPQALSDRLQGMETLDMSEGALFDRFRKAQQLNREAKREDKKGDGKAGENARKELVRPIVQQAAAQRVLRAIGSPAQLQEVLVDFWFNHFNVFAGKGPVSVWVGSYEREAIRPHVLGSFRAMLGATAKHPAMLYYLDNYQSVAPGWHPRVRRFAAEKPNQPSGLNENYARELMELHTLGVDGGYTQGDVTQLARMLTGWTVDLRGDPNALFRFDPERHDRGTKQWLGRTVAGAGQSEGEMALDVLAAHPATARHIAFQFAQAFVADEPPPALVKRLADRFLATQGDLRELTRTLIQSDEFWSRAAYQAKFKTPYQYVLSSVRALNTNDMLPPEVQPLLGALVQAGMPLYGAQTPDGYKNTAVAWANPEALSQRIQLAQTLGDRTQRRPVMAARAPDELLSTLGPLVSDSTRKSVSSEPANTQVALLLGSPDFMRR
ncbi:MAG TPA: DUF1800 domain-containing protein [Burkholderiaceae bacterium]|jgi:uncharacterized protein (DUF1800 family)